MSSVPPPEVQSVASATKHFSEGLFSNCTFFELKFSRRRSRIERRLLYFGTEIYQLYKLNLQIPLEKYSAGDPQTAREKEKLLAQKAYYGTSSIKF